jgi:aryl-alcohol dehydrogenase-like predicted oxidoreductase
MQLPRLGIGTNTFGRKVDQAMADSIVDTALNAGVTFFDTAESYADGASERLLGAALGRRRNDAFVATKFSPNNDPIAACERSLQRLGTDHIDLYQMHFPSPEIPLETTLEALGRLVEQGKVLAIGCSNYRAWQIADANWTSITRGLPRFVTAQNKYNLIEREAEAELLPACQHFGLRLIPYLPLAGGLLSGKYQRDASPPTGSRLEDNPRAGHYLTGQMFDRVERLEAFAANRGISLLAVAIGGLATTPGVATVIAGVTKPEQVLINKRAADWTPTREEIDAMRELTK